NAYARGADDPNLRFMLHQAMLAVDARRLIVRVDCDIRSGGYSEDGTRFAYFCGDDVEVRNVGDGARVGTVHAGKHDQTAEPTLDRSGARVVVPEGNVAAAYDVASGRPLARFDLGAVVEAVRFIHDNEWIAAGGEERVRIWQVAGGGLVRAFEAD